MAESSVPLATVFPFVPPAGMDNDDMPAASAPTVDITPLAACVKEYARLKLAIAELEEAAKYQRAEIEHALGEREIGLIDGRAAVTYKYVSSARFDVARFRKAHPDLADEFLTESHSRRFTLRGEA